MEKATNDNYREKVMQIISCTVARTNSRSSATAVSALAQMYKITQSNTILTGYPDIQVPVQDGELYNAYIGVCQFIFSCAQLRGLSSSELSMLNEKWQTCFKGFLDRRDNKDFSEAVFLAAGFLRSEGEALELDFVYSTPPQYYGKIYTDREAMFHHSPYALEEKLTKAVVKGDGDAALEALYEIRNHGDKAIVANDPVRSAKNSMIGSIAFLARATIQAGVNADKAFALSDSLIQQVEGMSVRKAILDFEESFLLSFIDLVNRRLEATYSVTITRVIHYIESRLNTRIPLEDAAAYAGVHPAYLSARFKKETGFTYSGFVMLRKIQESTYFVRHTKYLISQIALIYGFSSQSHYITSFKKVMGMTPMEYRRRYMVS